MSSLPSTATGDARNVDGTGGRPPSYFTSPVFASFRDAGAIRTTPLGPVLSEKDQKRGRRECHFTTAPVNCAIAASVVCAALRPSRKSASL